MVVRFKKKDLGKLAIIKWDDATGYTMEDIISVKLSPCTTVGWITKLDESCVVLASSIYDGEEYGDYTCLPLGMCKTVTILDEPEQALPPVAAQPSRKCSPKASPRCRRCGESCESGCLA